MLVCTLRLAKFPFAVNPAQEKDDVIAVRIIRISGIAGYFREQFKCHGSDMKVAAEARRKTQFVEHYFVWVVGLAQKHLRLSKDGAQFPQSIGTQIAEVGMFIARGDHQVSRIACVPAMA